MTSAGSRVLKIGGTTIRDAQRAGPRGCTVSHVSMLTSEKSRSALKGAQPSTHPHSCATRRPLRASVRQLSRDRSIRGTRARLRSPADGGYGKASHVWKECRRIGRRLPSGEDLPTVGESASRMYCWMSDGRPRLARCGFVANVLSVNKLDVARLYAHEMGA